MYETYCKGMGGLKDVSQPDSMEGAMQVNSLHIIIDILPSLFIYLKV